MKYIFIMLFILVILITSILLGTHNNQILSFNYLIDQKEFKASTLFSIIFVVGFIIGWITCGFFWLRTSLSLLYAKREVKRLTQQIAKATNIASQYSSKVSN